MWKVFTFLFILGEILSVSLVDCHEIDESIVSLVAEASSTLFFPSAAISAILCAKTDGLTEISRILSKHYILTKFLSVDELESGVRHQSSIIQFPTHKTIILLDFDCPEASQVLRKANSSGLFSAPLKWLILQDLSKNNCSDDCIIENFGSLTMYPDSEIIMLLRMSEVDVRISSIYRPSPVRGMIIEDRGFWRSDVGIKMQDTHVASRRRKNLHGTPLKSSLVVTDPNTLNHLTDYREKHVDTITKCNYVWLHQLCTAMNATVTYNTLDSWGYRDKNNSWNGMMGYLSRKEIDIGGTSMFLVADRWDDAHYIPLSTPTRAVFIFRQPPLSFVSNLFSLPFRRSVWIAIGVLLCIIFVMLFISMKWEWSRLDVDTKEFQSPSFSYYLLMVIGVVAQQGFGLSPRTVPSRVVLLMLLLAALNLYASYSANIVALLQSTTNSIQNLKDLLDSPMKCGAQDIVYNRYYFKVEKDPIRRSIIDQKIEPKGGKSNWMTAEAGINAVRQGFFAFYMETGPGYKIVQETYGEDEKCGFREMYFIEHFDPMFAIALQSPYKEIIRVNALKLEETGLKSREVRRLYTKRPPCNGLSKFISVGLSDCYFAFYTVTYGSLLAISIFFAELLWLNGISTRRKGSIDNNELDQSIQ